MLKFVLITTLSKHMSNVNQSFYYKNEFLFVVLFTSHSSSFKKHAKITLIMQVVHMYIMMWLHVREYLNILLIWWHLGMCQNIQSMSSEFVEKYSLGYSKEYYYLCMLTYSPNTSMFIDYVNILPLFMISLISYSFM